MKIQSSLKKWERLNDVYKEALDSRRKFYQTYQSRIRYKELKRELFLNKFNIKDRVKFLRQF